MRHTHRSASFKQYKRRYFPVMTRFPDEVPVADAIEQVRSGLAETEETEEPLYDDTTGPAPLETDESDWQEQHQVVGDFGEDDFR